MSRIVRGRVGILMVAGLAGVVTLSAPLAWAEKVEMVTFFPSPNVAETPPPTKPYTMYFTIPQAENGTSVNWGHIYNFDVYTILQLWKFGVARSQVQLVDHRFFIMRHVFAAPDELHYLGRWDQISPSPLESAPRMLNGALVLWRFPSFGDPANIEVTITW